jgi:hypothetical protein
MDGMMHMDSSAHKLKMCEGGVKKKNKTLVLLGGLTDCEGAQLCRGPQERVVAGRMTMREVVNRELVYPTGSARMTAAEGERRPRVVSLFCQHFDDLTPGPFSEQETLANMP